MFCGRGGRLIKGAAARWLGRVAVRQSAGAGSPHLAIARGLPSNDSTASSPFCWKGSAGRRSTYLGTAGSRLCDIMNQRAIDTRKICILCCSRVVRPTTNGLPDDVATLKAMVIATQKPGRTRKQSAQCGSRLRAHNPLSTQMKFTIAKLRHERPGQSRYRPVLEQLERSFAEMEKNASQGKAAAWIDTAASVNIKVMTFERRRQGAPAVARVSAARPRRLTLNVSLPSYGGVLL